MVIEPGFSIYIPDAFSPNGDGVNDVFTAKGTFVYNYHMWVFDRWGMQLYYCEDINKGWPGTVQSSGSNEICQEDTYVYLIICYDRQNNKHQFLGKVTLIK
jgi:gliding motility-associated-like protein